MFFFITPASSFRFKEATLIIKKSSKLDEKIAKKRHRSRRGLLSSSASSNTRSLKASQLISRSIRRSRGLVDIKCELTKIVCLIKVNNW